MANQYGGFGGFIPNSAGPSPPETWTVALFLGVTSKTPVATISKEGAGFSAASGSPAIEIANGWYRLVLQQSEFDTNGALAIHLADTDTSDHIFQVVPNLPGKLATDAVNATALATDAAQEIADALLDRTAGVETSRTIRQALRLILSACCNKLDGAGTTTVHTRDTADAKNRITATVDSSGNRTAITFDVS